MTWSERAEPMPEPDRTACGDLKILQGRRVRRVVAQRLRVERGRQTGRVQRLSQDLEQVKKRASGTVVKHRVEYLPFVRPPHPSAYSRLGGG
jgi:hypothetical protein